MHPQWQQKKLRDYCSKHNIHVSAWSPLGAPNTPWGSNVVIENPIIQEIAQKHGKTKAQVFICSYLIVLEILFGHELET